MKIIAAIAGTAAVGAVVGVGDAYVNLQGSTPGTVQNGHLNINGTAKAGTVVAYSSAPSGIAYGGDFRSVSNQGRGVLGNASSPTGVTYGGLFQSASSTGRGVAGISSATTGIAVGGFFTTNSTSGKGVQGTSNAATGVNYGVYGLAASPSGYGIYSDGNAKITKNLGVGMTSETPLTSRLQIADNSGETGGSLFIHNGSGTLFNNFGASRTGAYVQADGDGVYAIGVAGAASSTDETTYGLFGDARSNLSANAYGIYARAQGGSTNYGGYFEGLLYANNASAGVKNFMIDHPLDPANKVLTHSSVESDQRMNLYRGSIRTNGKGYATMTVPSWFTALNEDIKYQLTVVDEADSSSFVLAKVVKRLRNNQFSIRTSQPNIDVDWMLTGERHDPTANHYPLRVERDKTVSERGKYYDPAAYGKPDKLGMGRMDPVQTSRPPKK